MHPRVTELFVKKWREQKHRKLPGCSASRGFADAVDELIYVFDLRVATQQRRFAFPGKLEKLDRKGKAGEALPPRFILKQVPAILLSLGLGIPEGRKRGVWNLRHSGCHGF